MNRNQLLRKLLEDTSDDTHDHMSALEKTGFWGSRGAGCIFLSKSSGKILLPYRSANVREGHTWGVWGGAINRDMKDPVDAVVQEVREETGYKGNYDLTHLSVFTSGSFKYYNYLAVVEEEFTPKLNWETDEAQWFSYEEFLNIEPKHFGLEYLIAKSRGYIKRKVDVILNELETPKKLKNRSELEKIGELKEKLSHLIQECLNDEKKHTHWLNHKIK